jgi:hypothetical protein
VIKKLSGIAERGLRELTQFVTITAEITSVRGQTLGCLIFVVRRMRLLEGRDVMEKDMLLRNFLCPWSGVNGTDTFRVSAGGARMLWTGLVWLRIGTGGELL